MLTAAVAVAAPAQAHTQVSIGFGVGPGYYGSPYYRPWGPRPYWGGYRSRAYWGPSIGLYAAFPPTVVDAWPEPSRAYHQQAYLSALSGPLGQTYSWRDGRSSGTVTALRDGYSGDRYCREFRQDVAIDGRDGQVFGAACQDRDGTWRIVPNNP